MLLEMTRSAQAGIRKERQYEVTTNHLANANTTGFKGDILTFDNMMRAKITTDHRQGDIVPTGNDLDLALGDKGFFKILTPTGAKYTRNGNFTVDRGGRLVTQTGDPVAGRRGPILVNGQNVSINEAGQVFVDGNLTETLNIVDFQNKDLLEKEGNSFFVYKGNMADEAPSATVNVKQGALENANVSTLMEMTKMIEDQRMYETINRMMRSYDELDSRAISLGSPAK